MVWWMIRKHEKKAFFWKLLLEGLQPNVEMKKTAERKKWKVKRVPAESREFAFKLHIFLKALIVGFLPFHFLDGSIKCRDLLISTSV